MDYWDYLAHGAGGERKNHKYVARVPLGTRNGRVRFKYFYSSAEYAAYLRRSNKRRALNQKIGEQKKEMDRQRQARRNARRIGEQHSMDRKRWDTEARAEQVKKDAEAYRRKRSKQNVTRQKVAMDAKRYRKQRQAQRWAEIQERKKEMDRKRHKRSVANKKKEMDRKRHKQNVTRQKVAMDAKRYRKQRLQKYARTHKLSVSSI